MISTDHKGVAREDLEENYKVANFIRQAKKAWVKMEVCMYAVKVFGVDPAILMPDAGSPVVVRSHGFAPVDSCVHRGLLISGGELNNSSLTTNFSSLAAKFHSSCVCSL